MIIIITTKIIGCEIPCSTIKPERDLNRLVFLYNQKLQLEGRLELYMTA